MKKLILLFIIICAVLLADKVYLADGQIFSGTLDVNNGAFVLTGQNADVAFHDDVIDVVEKDGVKYTPEQYVAALENASEYEYEYEDEDEDAEDEYEYVEETVEYGFDALTLHDKIKLY